MTKVKLKKPGEPEDEDDSKSDVKFCVFLYYIDGTGS